MERTKNDANDNDKTSSLLDAWMHSGAEKRQAEVKSRRIWPRYRRSLEGSRRVQFSVQESFVVLEEASVKPMMEKETGLSNARNDDGWELMRRTAFAEE